MIEIHSTKTFLNLPCAHAQFFDLEPDGSPGECASIHGYDRSVTLTFSGSVDEQGWIVPFGELGRVKKFLEYYFDHTTVLPANDARIASIPESMTAEGGLLNKLRVLPYGVSMEMSALFILEHVNAYIMHITKGRCYVSQVECREHERNSAHVTSTRRAADAVYAKLKQFTDDYLDKATLPLEPVWPYQNPKELISQYNAAIIELS